ncbi:hypothetical protein GCM10009751_21820 [Myceligenerans crystallogenes]|uniref:Uncharacterized protein n=1 Tax=Myceligenerans crystallogenes TaxID=316335 RepID=A0ABN2ND64_9MICO
MTAGLRRARVGLAGAGTVAPVMRGLVPADGGFTPPPTPVRLAPTLVSLLTDVPSRSVAPAAILMHAGEPGSMNGSWTTPGKGRSTAATEVHMLWRCLG